MRRIWRWHIRLVMNNLIWRTHQRATHIHQLIHRLPMQSSISSRSTYQCALSASLHPSKCISLLLRYQLLTMVLSTRCCSLRSILVSTNTIPGTSITRSLNFSVTRIQVCNSWSDTSPSWPFLDKRTLDWLSMRLSLRWLLSNLQALIKVSWWFSESKERLS